MEHRLVCCQEIEHFRKWMRNIWEVLKCGDGEGLRKPVGLFKRKMKKYYAELRRKLIS